MLPAGSRVGDYEVEAELGAGGMATVYRARHVVLGSRVALKVLDPRFRANATARRRFLDEARIQHSHLDHPNVVKVTGIVATDDHAALVMELILGGSLEDELPRLRGRTDEIRAIMAGVLAGVGHAHAAGIIHRDLKPANVLLERRGGEVIPKVTDFGIAKLSAELAAPGKKSTHGDSRMGTLHYMSPEQIKRAKDVTPRSDIFSLGAMLYELATGALPFDGENDYDVMDQIIHGRYVPPEERDPRIDANLAAVIRQALAPDPERRFARCEAMAAALGSAPRRRTPTPAATQVMPQFEVPRSARPPTPVPLAEAQLQAIDAAATVMMPQQFWDQPAAPGQRPAAPGRRRAGKALGLTVVGLGAGALAAYLATRGRGDAGGPAAGAASDAPGAARAIDAGRGRMRRPVDGGGVALPSPSAPDPSDPWAGAAACPQGMVQVPRTTFSMGSADGEGATDEQPQHLVVLSPYCIDRTEVTVAAYAACPTCSPAAAMVDWGRPAQGLIYNHIQACNGARPDRGAHPVNCVTWAQADAYCRAVGKALPTEAQWELAARGPDGSAYPWGQWGAPATNLLNACDQDCATLGAQAGATWQALVEDSDGHAATAPVGSYQNGTSPYGALDMAGNVWEWVADGYAPYSWRGVADPPPVSSSDGRHVVRGGGWMDSDPAKFRGVQRTPHTGSLPGVDIGFRCAAPVP